MNKLLSIALAAGLSLTASCGKTTIMNECKRVLPREDKLLNIDGRQVECEEIFDKKTREHCTMLVKTTKEKALSACMTRQTKKPFLCNYENGVWDCKALRSSKDKENIYNIFK